MFLHIASGLWCAFEASRLPTLVGVDREAAEGRLETPAGGAGATEGAAQAGAGSSSQR